MKILTLKCLVCATCYSDKIKSPCPNGCKGKVLIKREQEIEITVKEAVGGKI